MLLGCSFNRQNLFTEYVIKSTVQQSRDYKVTKIYTEPQAKGTDITLIYRKNLWQFKRVCLRTIVFDNSQLIVIGIKS